MSFNDVYEFIQGEYQQVTRIRQEPVSTADPTFFKDLNLVKWAGFSIEIWSAETGGTQLVQGLDYELQYLDVAASGPDGEPVYSGYDILTPLYYNIPLYQTANIVGAYTTRPYRPSYDVVTADATVTPVSMDDSVIADASAGNIIIKLEDGFHLNQRYSIICKGTGTVTVGGTGIGAGASFQGVGVSWLWDGDEWMPLAAPGAREGGIYYNWELVYENTGAASPIIPNASQYLEGLSYAAVEFTYQGETVRASGTFAYYDDGIDRYSILADDVQGSDSTLSLRYDSGTDTLEAVEVGSDFTNLNLYALYDWKEYTFGGFGAWGNTVEAPPYGEAITSEQELYLDGTKEFVSSSGNAPVVDVVDYLPAVINVDGAETPEAASKWPGQRGTYGFFGEYDNQAINANRVVGTNASLAIEGDWMKVASINTSADNQNSIYYAWTVAIDGGYYTVDVRRGNTDVSKVGGSASTGIIDITWDTQAVVFGDGAVDAGTFWLSDDIVRLKALGTPGFDKVRMYLFSQNNSDPIAIGDHTYFRNPMQVSTTYPVPYQAGTHQPAKLQYSKDWAESAEWTIQGWFKTESAESASKYCIQSRGPNNSSFNFIIAYVDDSGILSIITSDAGGTTSVLSGNAVTLGEYFHIKVTYISATSAELFQNGVSVGTITTNIPISSDMFKTLTVGGSILNSGAITTPLNGYGNDVTIQPGIDTSDAHYLSGLPYYNPNKTYGKNASWSIDARGNISGNNQVAGSIIQDEEINGQLVTRWDTGLMSISGTTDGSPNPLHIDFEYAFVGSERITITIACYTEYARMTNFSGLTVTGVDLYRFDSSANPGAPATSTMRWSATGRWK